jgi:hypothetical protein
LIRCIAIKLRDQRARKCNWNRERATLRVGRAAPLSFRCRINY